MSDTLALRLQKAEAAYDDLITGRSIRVVVDQSGERIEYQAANAARLAAYISELRRSLEQSSPSLGPMRFLF